MYKLTSIRAKLHWFDQNRIGPGYIRKSERIQRIDSSKNNERKRERKIARR
jgi:hypothetical protein